MKWIDYARPGSVREAVDLLAEHGDRARILAGGTDILVQLRGGRFELDLLVDVKGIPELNEISYDSGSGLTLGAAVPCHKIYADATVNDVYPGIIDVATLIGGTQIQGRATFGGNLCNAAPSADSIPILIALHATAKVVGPDGTREFAVEDMCTAPGQNQLKRGEMLVSIHFPPPESGSGAHYMRFIPRNEMDIAVAGAGVSVVLDNGTLKEARVALAHQAGADLFVSLHADAIEEGIAHGATVYTLSDDASDAASAALAERHDRDDILAGLDLSGADDRVADVLLDLARLDNSPRSTALATHLVDRIRNAVGTVHKRPLRHAGFSVLKAADIPSVLVEVGFLSTAKDLDNLQDEFWRASMAAGIRDGIAAWALEDAALARLRRQ